MASLVPYRGLQIVSPDPTGDGGLAIQNDLKSLVEWAPKSAWSQVADPGASDDQAEDFFPGSLWLRTNTSPPVLFICTDSATGAAVWQEIASSESTVPYTGATENVDLGFFRLRSSGLNAGFDPSSPNQEAGIQSFWFQRTADLSHGWDLDYQDEFALIDAKGASVTISPSQDVGTLSNVFRDNSLTVVYYSGNALTSIQIEVDASSVPILAKGRGLYSVGITYRNPAGPSVTATHIKIEVAPPSGGYSPAFDEDVDPVSNYGQWVSPEFAATAPNYHIAKLRLTMDFPSPLPTELRLQRLILYHGTAVYDPWHLHLLGGTLYGALGIGVQSPHTQFQVAGPIATAISVKTSTYTVSATDSVVICDATSGALTVNLPTAIGIAGRQYTVKRINSGANNVTVDPNGSQAIDGSSTLILSSQYQAVQIISDGANWYTL